MRYIRSWIDDVIGRVRMQFTVKCTYCGNIYDKDANTYCPKCGKKDWVKY
jgi:rRNA maturation endonuclease Nob1